MYKSFFISKNVLIQEEAAAAVPAPYPSFKPVNSKPSPDYKYQAFKAQNAAAVAGSSFSGSAAGSGFGGAPKLSGRPQPIAEEEDSFYGVDAQNFYAAERDAQPDRRQAPSSGDFAGAASNNDDGFGPFFGNGNFQSGPVSAAAAPGESVEEILAKKNKATPERPGFTPPKLIERFSSPVVEPSISYNQPQPQVTSFC